MPITIEKTFRFDAGHRALGFKYKKEETIHGHTWYLRLVVETGGQLDSYKTIFDTNDLSVIVKPIIEEIDHSFIIWKEDPLYPSFVELCQEGRIRENVYEVDFNPTIEGLAEFLFKTVKSKLHLHNAMLKRA